MARLRQPVDLARAADRPFLSSAHGRSLAHSLRRRSRSKIREPALDGGHTLVCLPTYLRRESFAAIFEKIYKLVTETRHPSPPAVPSISMERKMTQLLMLGQELNWQVLELRRAKADAAEAHASDHEALERRVIATADKIQRELLAMVRFDPERLFGIGG